MTDRRLRGYRAAFAAAGAPLRDPWVVAAPASIAGGAAAFRAAWNAGRRPTAVLAMSDGLAIGVMAAARELGLRVPDELSVVGFDDLDVAGSLEPPLTTVRQGIREKGASAVRLLVAAIETPGARPDRVRLPAQLQVRGSTAPPRDHGTDAGPRAAGRAGSAAGRAAARVGGPPCDDPPHA